MRCSFPELDGEMVEGCSAGPRSSVWIDAPPTLFVAHRTCDYLRGAASSYVQTMAELAWGPYI